MKSLGKQILIGQDLKKFTPEEEIKEGQIFMIEDSKQKMYTARAKRLLRGALKQNHPIIKQTVMLIP